MLIVDTPYNTTAKVSALQKNNIGTVIRYYNFSNSKKFPDKCLTLIEAQSICEAGMSIAVVFQQNQNSAGDFSDYQGYEAGLKAYRYAMNDIGQPKGSAIYFRWTSTPMTIRSTTISSRTSRVCNGHSTNFRTVSRTIVWASMVPGQPAAHCFSFNCVR